MRHRTTSAHCCRRDGIPAVAGDLDKEPHMNGFPSPRVGRWLAAASACTLAGVCASSTAGASTMSLPPPIPPGYVALIDDTNRISIMVPPTWTDIQTGSVDVAGTPT